jgi:alkanesulfonate monooxygenase SsuD/methylene tetrahydromethanopterin reductase-like flavin-dependent oxidoreductase (luciferase family)
VSDTQRDTARPAPLFGISIAPSARDVRQALVLAQIADETGLDLVAMQDHPYNATFLDTWTLLATIGAQTQHVRLLPDVLNLPLRPPAVLAKAAATLDLLTGGRFEMGLGAGGFWDAIVGYGGPRRTPAEAVAALEEAMQVMRALWQPMGADQAITFAGKQYHLDGAQPGPAPAHPIGIWLGVNGPRMLQLTGASADGWVVSAGYVPPEVLPERQDAIDSAARAAGRDSSAIRRAYNVAGVVLQPGDPVITPRRSGILVASADEWVETLTRYYHNLRMDTFIFWAAGREQERQARLFAEQVAPAARRALGAETQR